MELRNYKRKQMPGSLPSPVRTTYKRILLILYQCSATGMKQKAAPARILLPQWSQENGKILATNKETKGLSKNPS
jgi:hypothetical protein